MKKILLVTGFLVCSVPLCASAAPGTPYSDEWIEGRVRGMLDFNTYFDSTDIKVDVKEGVATLSGEVPSEIEKKYASSLASSLDGVKSVANKLKVNESLAARSRTPEAQTFLDTTTSAMVESRLSSSALSDDGEIVVSTRDGIVMLTGKVPDSKSREQAGKIAATTTNVVKVDNNLTIADAKSIGDKVENALVATSNAVSDTWILAKVRARIAFSSEYSGANVSTNVENGKVMLKGVTRTPEQIAEITKEVSEVVGVREVDNRLTVRP